MAGICALVAGLLTFLAVWWRPGKGSMLWVRILSLSPLLLLYGALASSDGMTVYHFTLEGLRFDLADKARTLSHFGGLPPSASPTEKKEEEPYLSFGDFVSSSASSAKLAYEPKEGLSLVCEDGDIVGGVGSFTPEGLASPEPRFCHVIALQEGDELRLSSSGGSLVLPISLTGETPSLAGCAAPDGGGLRSVRAFALLDAFNQIGPNGCRTDVNERPDSDERKWRFQPSTTSENQRLLLPIKSYLFWVKGEPSRTYLALLDPGLALWRGGQQVEAPKTISVRHLPAPEEGAEGTQLASDLARDPERLVFVRRLHSLRYEAQPSGCGKGGGSPLCSFFRVELSERALSLQGETSIDDASVIRADLEEPAVVPVRDEALRVEDTRRPVLFLSGWGGSLTREEAQTTLLFPHQVGGLGPLRVRFDVTDTGVAVTAPNSTGQYEGSALVVIGARKAQLLIGVSRYEAPWFLLWLFGALLLGRAILLPRDFWAPRAPRAAIFVASYLLAFRALFGLKAYVLFPVDRESFELALLGAALVPAVLVSAIAFAREVASKDEMPGPWGVALGHALLCIGAASAYYTSFSFVSKLVFFVLGGTAVVTAALAPLVSYLQRRYKGRLRALAPKLPKITQKPLFWPLVLAGGLFLLRAALAVGGLHEAVILGGNRVPFSIFHVPIGYVALAWIAQVEGKWAGKATALRPITFLCAGALFVVIPGMTDDWGMMLLGLPPVLLVLGARKVVAARLLLLALALIVGVPKIFGEALAPAIVSLAGPKRFDMSNGAYRLLLTLDQESLDGVGSIGSDRVAEHSTIITRYAQGQSGGSAAIFGDGYLSDDIKAYGAAVVQTLMTDGVAATYLMPEFGILGVAGVLLALSSLLIFGLSSGAGPEEDSLFSVVRAMMATYVAFAGFYMIAAPISLVFFTGKNFPLLSIISKSDLLEGGLFLFLAGMYLPREEKTSPSTGAKSPGEVARS